MMLCTNQTILAPFRTVVILRNNSASTKQTAALIPFNIKFHSNKLRSVLQLQVVEHR